MTTATETRNVYYSVRLHETDRGTLAVFAERDADGRKRPHHHKGAAFAAAGLLGGRAAGFHVLEITRDENGNPCAVSYPRGDSGGGQ